MQLAHLNRTILVVVFYGALMAPTARAQGQLDNADPFTWGKLDALLEWLTVNCGGSVTPYARAGFARAKAQDSKEYARGHAETAKEASGYIPAVGAKVACGNFTAAFQMGRGTPVWVP